jgi:hypothetical protein
MELFQGVESMLNPELMPSLFDVSFQGFEPDRIE